MTIILPSGYRINLDNSTTYYNPSGAPKTVVFTFAVGVGSGTWTETFLTAETAASFMLQLDSLVGSGQTGIASPTGSPTRLVSVTPNPFSMHGGGYILVNGNRFDPDAMGSLYFNDVGTAPDFLGYKMDCQYLNPTQARAVWVSDGSDPNLLDEQVAYYKDMNGLVSNVLGGVFLKNVTALTFTSVTPSSISVGTGTSFALAGTGFLASGITTLKLDDGAGNVNKWSEASNPVGGYGVFTIDSDASITMGDSFTYSVATTYTIYYSINGGATWTTTGKTVTVS